MKAFLHADKLSRAVEAAHSSLVSAYKLGFDHWVIMFSGGKDSTATVVLALETISKENLPLRRLDVVYADTLVEIPIIRQFALEFLDFLHRFDEVLNIPFFLHVVYPALEDSFWVCLLGKGYPPPHFRFRWCTKRLKIKPVESMLKKYSTVDKTLIITGVRFGESQDRDKRLNDMNDPKDHEIFFTKHSRLGLAYLSPIASWEVNDVWAFLNFVAPSHGYPTQMLERKVYKERDLRFGCWTCTVVRQDETMEKIISQPEWANLRALLAFRARMLSITSRPESRYRRKNGVLGRLSLRTRAELLQELLQLQDDVGMSLIREEEIALIKSLWTDPRYGEY